jgi:hypothetical protein
LALFRFWLWNCFFWLMNSGLQLCYVAVRFWIAISMWEKVDQWIKVID